MDRSEASQDRHIVEALRRKGYRATPQRIAICRLAISSRDHPTAQRIYKDVKAQYPTVSLATVYKTIGVLKELHMVQELTVIGGDTKFDPNMKAHVNLICLRCGNVRDLENQAVQDMIVKAARAVRFDVTGQSSALYGICDECETKKEESRV
ncbi:MAG: Fur family transcriptional regulator [archaeon]